jgi:hypothetical protein
MNLKLKIHTTGRPAHYVTLTGPTAATRAAEHIRTYASAYGISPYAVDYDVLST